MCILHDKDCTSSLPPWIFAIFLIALFTTALGSFTFTAAFTSCLMSNSSLVEECNKLHLTPMENVIAANFGFTCGLCIFTAGFYSYTRFFKDRKPETKPMNV
jgi:hypothetical protein